MTNADKPNRSRREGALLIVGATVGLFLATAGLSQAQTVAQHTAGPKAKVLKMLGGLPPPPPTPPAKPVTPAPKPAPGH